MHSTQKGYASFRDHNEGSVFIQAIQNQLKILSESDEKFEILEILEAVRDKVSKEITYYSGRHCRQIPEIAHSLRRKFMLLRKLTEK